MAADFSAHPLFPAVRELGERIMAGSGGTGEAFTIGEGAAASAVTLTPLGFQDWRVAVIIPEEEFLGDIRRTTERLAFILIGFVALAALVSTYAARRLVAEPLRAVAGDLEQIESFTLDRIAHRPSRLAELDALSSALVRMAGGLNAFGKYLPRDLVRRLVAEGVEAKPGGTTRPLTVLFADVAGFTGISERLGGDIVPLIGAYLEHASNAVERNGGTVDKFIGDAVMAFWGAPQPDPDHALNACRAALAMLEAVRATGLVDDAGRPLRIRIGVNSGTVLVGNIGSSTRLNYTALGDAVNVASRLEGANKVYDTAIIIGEETRRLAGDRIVVRELDEIAVYGRTGGTAIFELVGLAGESPESLGWVAAYADGLRRYRDREWVEAIALFATVVAMRGGDRPSELMIERCSVLLEAPPETSWSGVTALRTK
jgi:adenylate cyclase